MCWFLFERICKRRMRYFIWLFFWKGSIERVLEWFFGMRLLWFKNIFKIGCFLFLYYFFLLLMKETSQTWELLIGLIVWLNGINIIFPIYIMFVMIVIAVILIIDIIEAMNGSIINLTIPNIFIRLFSYLNTLFSSIKYLS